MIKAAVAHLWFVTIHPFEDGNGRIARAIADMALARSELSPQRFYSLSARTRAERNAYYDVLEATQKGDLDITAWLEWFLGCLDHAFAGAELILSTVLRKARFWRVHAGERFNDRQQKLLSRVLGGFTGALTSSKWAAIAKTSQDTANRDIDNLMKRRILFKEAGGGRSTRYRLIVTGADALNAVADDTRQNANVSVWNGPALPDSNQRKQRREAIEHQADLLDALAARSLREIVTYAAFDPILQSLHQLGSFPEDNLVSDIAFVLQRDQQSPPLLGSKGS